jgi:hypothetical protein
VGGMERREEGGGDDDDEKRWRGVVRGPLPGPCPSALSLSPFSRTWYQAAKSSSFLADMPSLVSFLPDERVREVRRGKKKKRMVEGLVRGRRAAWRRGGRSSERDLLRPAAQTPHPSKLSPCPWGGLSFLGGFSFLGLSFLGATPPAAGCGASETARPATPAAAASTGGCVSRWFVCVWIEVLASVERRGDGLCGCALSSGPREAGWPG